MARHKHVYNGERWKRVRAIKLHMPQAERDKLLVSVERGGGPCVNECLTTVKRPLTWGSGQPMDNQQHAIAGIC